MNFIKFIVLLTFVITLTQAKGLKKRSYLEAITKAAKGAKDSYDALDSSKKLALKTVGVVGAGGLVFGAGHAVGKSSERARNRFENSFIRPEFPQGTTSGSRRAASE